MTATPPMELLYQRLRSTAADDADVRLLAEDQLLVSRNLIDTPDAARAGKSATRVPGPDGYEIYLARRPAEIHARQAGLSQRMTGPRDGPPVWDGRTMQLRLAPGETRGEWVVGDGRGGIVTVHAAAGSDQVLDAVNAILSQVEAVLLT
jgi:hypothetical protein